MRLQRTLLTATVFVLSLFFFVQPINALTFPSFSFQFPTRVIRTAPRILPTATPTKIPPPTPTTTPTPTPTKTQSTTTSTQQTNTHDQIQNFLMQAINDYRAKNGLSKVLTSQETCDFAKIRAQEITKDFSHNGFRQRINNKTIPYKTWTKITENIAMTSNYKEVVNLWINSSGHAANMQADTPYVCVEFVGNYYAYEGHRP